MCRTDRSQGTTLSVNRIGVQPDGKWAESEYNYVCNQIWGTTCFVTRNSVQLMFGVYNQGTTRCVHQIGVEMRVHVQKNSHNVSD